jgi:hypothetical protein
VSDSTVCHPRAEMPSPDFLETTLYRPFSLRFVSVRPVGLCFWIGCHFHFFSTDLCYRENTVKHSKWTVIPRQRNLLLSTVSWCRMGAMQSE